MDIAVKRSRDSQKERDTVWELRVAVMSKDAVYHVAGVIQKHEAVDLYQLQDRPQSKLLVVVEQSFGFIWLQTLYP